jgi:hypothetical protein
LRQAFSINEWEDAVLDNLLVLVPIVSILLVAIMVVSHITMDQQYGKVNDVEVGDDAINT